MTRCEALSGRCAAPNPQARRGRIAATLGAVALAALATGHGKAQTIVDTSGDGLSAGERTTIRQSIALGFSDPTSTQIREIRAPTEGRLCGEVNGKNVFGVYTGFRPFLIDSASGRVTILDPQDPPELQEFHRRTFSLGGCPIGPDGLLLTFN